jgi:hypothetical protein
MRTNRVTDPNTREYPSLDGTVHHLPAAAEPVRVLRDPRVRCAVHPECVPWLCALCVPCVCPGCVPRICALGVCPGCGPCICALGVCALCVPCGCALCGWAVPARPWVCVCPVCALWVCPVWLGRACAPCVAQEGLREGNLRCAPLLVQLALTGRTRRLSSCAPR